MPNKINKHAVRTSKVNTLNLARPACDLMVMHQWLWNLPKGFFPLHTEITEGDLCIRRWPNNCSAMLDQPYIHQMLQMWITEAESNQCLTQTT
jgi:hypothetical protein